MMNLGLIGQTIESVMTPYIERSLKMDFPTQKEALIQSIRNYKNLTNRQWKKKRELLLNIAFQSIGLSDFIENMDVPNFTPSQWNRLNKKRFKK